MLQILIKSPPPMKNKVVVPGMSTDRSKEYLYIQLQILNPNVWSQSAGWGAVTTSGNGYIQRGTGAYSSYYIQCGGPVNSRITNASEILHNLISKVYKIGYTYVGYLAFTSSDSSTWWVKIYPVQGFLTKLWINFWGDNDAQQTNKCIGTRIKCTSGSGSVFYMKRSATRGQTQFSFEDGASYKELSGLLTINFLSTTGYGGYNAYVTPYNIVFEFTNTGYYK